MDLLEGYPFPDTFRINEIELRLKLFDRIAPMSPEDLRVRFDACGKHYRIESNGGGPDYDTKEPAFYAIAIRNIAMQLILNHGFAGAPFASPRRVMGPRRRFLLTRPIPATLPPHIQYRIGTVVQRMQVLPDSERPAAYGTRAQCELEARGWFALASMHDRPHPLACAALAACLLGSEADSGGARATLPRSYHDAAFFLWRGSQHGAAWPGASAADSREARELCAGRLRDLVNKGHRAHFAHLATKDWPAALPPPTEEEAHALVTLLHMGPVRLQQLANPPFSDPRAMYLVALQQLGTPDLRVYAYLDLAHDTTTWLQQVWVWVLCSEQLNEGLILSLLQASRDGGFAPAAALLEAAGEESEAGFPEHCRRLVAPLEPGLKSYWEDTACPMESDGGRITATPSFSMQPKKGHPLEAAASAKEKQALVREEMRKVFKREAELRKEIAAADAAAAAAAPRPPAAPAPEAAAAKMEEPPGSAQPTAAAGQTAGGDADDRSCVNCGRKDVKTRLCGGCKQARYCSEECQRAAWTSGHRAACAGRSGAAAAWRQEVA